MDQRLTIGLDIKTPLNASLTAYYKRSFAHHTVKNRMPVIITQTIDTLVRRKDIIIRNYGENAGEELKTIIGELSKLKYEIQTNKSLRKLAGNTWDIKQYNKYLDDQTINADVPTFFSAIWLHAECYMYRKIREVIEQTNNLKDLDPFETQKQEAFHKSLEIMDELGKHLLHIFTEDDINKEVELIRLLKLNLWGNKCDLSLSNGVVNNDTDHLMQIEKLNAYILSDYSLDIWNTISKDKGSDIIDIVLDNSGYELYTDMCIADFLITNQYAKQIRFYTKTIPWFISDAMTKDIKWTLDQLKLSKNTVLNQLGGRWSNYIESKTWTIEEHQFWILPVPFQDMAEIDLNLYKKLSQAKLIIIKGDLNYRKLFGEKKWLPDTPIEVGLQGFHPSKLCTLRTLKADIICGLAKGLADIIEEKDKDWLVSGNYGVIQFCDKVTI